MAKIPLKFSYAPGINISGGEFGGTLGHAAGLDSGDWGNNNYYEYPKTAEVATWLSRGFKFIRIPVHWVHLINVSGTWTWRSSVYGQDISIVSALIDQVHNGGGTPIIDMHTYGYMYPDDGGATSSTGLIGVNSTATTNFANLWSMIAGYFASKPNVVWGLSNEPHDQTPAQWATGAQQAITAIRNAGSGHPILLMGSYWGGAHSWVANGNSTAMLNVTDPLGNLYYEMHQYFDVSTGYGGYDYNDASLTTTPMSTIMKPARDWAIANGVKILIGEVGVQNTSAGIVKLGEMFDYMAANKDAFIGWTYWAAGNIGTGYAYYPTDGSALLSKLQTYVSDYVLTSTGNQLSAARTETATTGDSASATVTRNTLTTISLTAGIPSGFAVVSSPSSYALSSTGYVAKAANAGRFTDLGLTLEPTVTNYIAGSAALHAAAGAYVFGGWYYTGTWTDGSAVADPVGGTAAHRFAVAAGVTAQFYQPTNNPAVGASQTMDLIYRVQSGTPSIGLGVINSGVSSVSLATYNAATTVLSTSVGFAPITAYGQINLGGGWFRLWLTFTDTENTLFYTLAITGAGTVDIWNTDAVPGASLYTPIVSGAGATTRAADNISWTVPAGISSLVFTFSDGTTQNVSVSPGAYTLPTSLAKPIVQSVAYASPGLTAGVTETITASDSAAATSSQSSQGVLDFTAGSPGGVSVGSTPAGYAPSSTALVSFSAGAMRRTDLGVMTEPSAINYLFNSNQAYVTGTPGAVGNWWSTGTWTSVGAANDPTGASTAWRYTAGSGSTAQFYFLRQNPITSGPQVVDVIYKVQSGTLIIEVGIINAAVTAATIVQYNWSTLSFVTAANVDPINAFGQISLGGGWYRLWFSFTDAGTGNLHYTFSLTGSGGSTTVDVWNVGCVAGSSPSTPIISGATATSRSADAINWTVPAGVSSLTFKFWDDTTQIVAVSPGAYTLPTNLSKQQVKTISYAQPGISGGVSENAVTGDVVTGVYAATAAAISETASATDVQAVVSGTFVSSSETAAATDSSVAAGVFAVALGETVAATDNNAATYIVISAITEGLKGGDQQAWGGVANASATETVSATDALSVLVDFVAAIAEIVAAGDTNAGGLITSAAQTDDAAANDAPSAGAVFVADRSEGLIVGESSNFALTLYAALTEALTSGDSFVSLGGGAFVVITETTAAGDINVGVFSTNVATGETVAATDAVSAASSLVAAATETAAATEASAPISFATAAATETAAATDSAASTAARGADTTETLATGETSTALALAAGAVTETAAAAEGALAGVIRPAAITETAAATDAVSALTALLALITESLATGEVSTSTYGGFTAGITERATPGDGMSATVVVTIVFDPVYYALKAVRAYLLADTSLVGLVGTRIFERAPQLTSTPFIVLGATSASDFSTADTDGEEVVIEVHYWEEPDTQSPETRLSREIARRVRELLHFTTITPDSPNHSVLTQVIAGEGPALQGAGLRSTVRVRALIDRG